MLVFALLGVFLVAASDGASFPSPMIQQITPPVDHAEGPTWDGRKNVLYYVDIHNGGVLAYHYDTNKLTRITLNGDVSPVVPCRKDPNLLLVGVNRSVVAVEWDGNKELGDQQVLTTVAKQHPTSRFNDGKADRQGRLWWGTMGYESPAGSLSMYQGAFYKITKENLEEPNTIKEPVSVSNGLAWNKANDKLYYIDTPTKRIVELNYDDAKGEVSAENRTAFDVAQYIGRIAGSPDGMTIDQDDNLWIALYGGGAVIKANPTTGELLKVVPLPARDVTSAMWGGPDLDVLFVTTSRHVLDENEKLQQPGAGSVFAISNLGTKGLPVYTADIIDSIPKRKSLLENLLSADIFSPLPKENANLVYPQSNEIPTEATQPNLTTVAAEVTTQTQTLQPRQVEIEPTIVEPSTKPAKTENAPSGFPFNRATASSNTAIWRTLMNTIRSFF